MIWKYALIKTVAVAAEVMVGRLFGCALDWQMFKLSVFRALFNSCMRRSYDKFLCDQIPNNHILCFFWKTLDNSVSASEIKENTPPMSPSKINGCTRSSHDSTEDEVFLTGEQSSKNGKPSSYSDPESSCGTTGQTGRARIPVDPDLIGAVQSWRAKAIWTCEPMPRESSGSETEVERIIQPHAVLVTKCTAPNIKPTLRQLAERLREQERLASAKTAEQIRVRLEILFLLVLN